MNTKVENKLDKLDAKLQNLLKDLESYSNEKLNHKPEENEWSVLQVIQHMLTVERLSTMYVKKKLSFNPTLKNTNISTQLRLLLLKSYNYLPIKLKAPKNVGDNLPEFSTLAETAEKWQATRQELRDFFATLSDEIFQKEVYKHPISGRMSLVHMLEFFEGHFDRHLKQIKRTLEA